MEIVAQGVGVAGTHGPILAPTSLRVRKGQPLLVAGDPNSGRTALAMVLSGRLRPSRGTVRLNGSRSMHALRRKVAVVDAPNISEPEKTISVRDVVAEGLSIAGRPARPSKVRHWLTAHDLEGHASERFDKLPAVARTRLLLHLAAENRATEALVLDCPDRHGGNPLGWYSLAVREAERGLAVIVLCTPQSAEKIGAGHVRIGVDDRAHDQPENPGQPENPELSLMDQIVMHNEGVR